MKMILDDWHLNGLTTAWEETGVAGETPRQVNHLDGDDFLMIVMFLVIVGAQILVFIFIHIHNRIFIIFIVIIIESS